MRKRGKISGLIWVRYFLANCFFLTWKLVFALLDLSFQQFLSSYQSLTQHWADDVLLLPLGDKAGDGGAVSTWHSLHLPRVGGNDGYCSFSLWDGSDSQGTHSGTFLWPCTEKQGSVLLFCLQWNLGSCPCCKQYGDDGSFNSSY